MSRLLTHDHAAMLIGAACSCCGEPLHPAKGKPWVCPACTERVDGGDVTDFTCTVSGEGETLANLLGDR